MNRLRIVPSARDAAVMRRYIYPLILSLVVSTVAPVYADDQAPVTQEQFQQLLREIRDLNALMKSLPPEIVQMNVQALQGNFKSLEQKIDEPGWFTEGVKKVAGNRAVQMAFAAAMTYLTQRLVSKTPKTAQ